MAKSDDQLKTAIKWVLEAPHGEARAISVRSDGNELVTVKQFLNSLPVSCTEIPVNQAKRSVLAVS